MHKEKECVLTVIHMSFRNLTELFGFRDRASNGAACRVGQLAREVWPLRLPGQANIRSRVSNAHASNGFKQT